MLENMLTRKGVMRAGKGAVRAGRRYNNMDHMNKNFLFSLHPLSNIAMTKYINSEHRFNDVYSRDNLL